MTPEQLEQVEELFAATADLPPSDRAVYLNNHCPDDSDVRKEVESLLTHDAAETFLEMQCKGAGIRVPQALEMFGFPEDALPERIGRYRIVRKVGAGGMGTVYEAEQDSPQRTVAVKVVHGGQSNPGLVRRFEREIHLLGQLVHPGIAQIYEAGFAETSHGRTPYFAMEFVRGWPLTEYAEKRQLGVRDRLSLIADVCDAVQLAHNKGIIHRDLKPGNILVDETGQPKILDFGVARAIDSDATTPELTIERTDVAQLIGTIPYMSPEQVVGRSSDVDTRSDVYTLGVILYELLAGRLPHDVRECSIPEAARIIHDEDPTRLSSINTVFRGDVETIVAKALEKDCDRRYQSAAELAGDIRRFLKHEPISARPASTVYQLRKFAKRNKKLVGVVAIAFVGLAVATVVSTRFGLGEAAQRRVADHERAVAHRSAYRTRIVAARMALQSNDAISARRILEEVPTEYRDNWEWKYVYSLLDSSDAALIGHTGAVTDVDFSPDGATLVSASKDHTLRLWDFETRSLIAELPGRDGRWAKRSRLWPAF